MEWLAQAHVQAEAANGLPDFNRQIFAEKTRKLFSRFGVSSDVGFRAAELQDTAHFDWDQMHVFNGDMDARMEAFSEAADRAFESFYPTRAPAPEGILHVTCTGYISPSAAQRIVVRRGWQESTVVTHAYHMGCAAAFPAVRIAQGFWDGSGRSTDIVHTEFCSLHLNPNHRDLEQVVVQALFADGAIRYTALSSQAEEPGLEVLALREEMIPDSEKAMTWVLSKTSMQMTLSRDVPVLIAGVLENFLERLFGSCGMSLKECREEAIFAVHPGGPQIISRIQDLLRLRNEQVQWSRDILFQRGNMSSATLPYVWKKIVDSADVPEGTLIVSMAFAPGLTVCGGIFRKCR